MNTSKIEYRNCVQIGLYETAEMIYLAQDNWYQLLPEIEEVDRIIAPEQYQQIQYNYYGIDEQPFCITHLQEQYKHIPRAKWMCIRAGYTSEICYQDGFSGNPKNFIGSFTLDQIFDCVCNNSGIDTIDVFKIDTEGGEYAILEKYSFKRKPRLLMIEAHGWEWCNNESRENTCKLVKQIVEPQGYTQILHTLTNFHDGIAHTAEMHFQLQD